MKTVLFVCTQNLFRSASAEFLFRKLLQDNKDSNFNVLSAGVKANDPCGMYDWTRERIIFHGGDPSTHKQEKVTPNLLSTCDIIVCMTKQHQDVIKSQFNTNSYLFNELTIGQKSDLEDDNEAHGSYSDLSTFVVSTVDLINDRLPLLYANLKKMDL